MLAAQPWRVLEDVHDAACLLCTQDTGTLVDTGLELEDGRRVLVCRDCGERLARSLKIGTKAATAALEEAKAEKAELQRQAADAAVERQRLTQLVDELRTRVHAHEFLWGQLGERTSELHALAMQGAEGG